MKFLFITLFPEQIEQAAGHSIIQRAVNKGLVEISCINPRGFTHDVHRTVDDTPFGGGAGMVLKPEPMVAAIRKAKKAIRHAFENSMNGKGSNLVEIVSSCNSGWKASPVKANEWMEENMFKYYHLGDLKDI